MTFYTFTLHLHTPVGVVITEIRRMFGGGFEIWACGLGEEFPSEKTMNAGLSVLAAELGATFVMDC